LDELLDRDIFDDDEDEEEELKGENIKTLNSTKLNHFRKFLIV
jgi:hypothetical protein